MLKGLVVSNYRNKRTKIQVSPKILHLLFQLIGILEIALLDIHIVVLQYQFLGLKKELLNFLTNLYDLLVSFEAFLMSYFDQLFVNQITQLSSESLQILVHFVDNYIQLYFRLVYLQLNLIVSLFVDFKSVLSWTVDILNNVQYQVGDLVILNHMI